MTEHFPTPESSDESVCHELAGLRQSARSAAMLEDSVVSALARPRGLRIGLTPQMRLHDGPWAAAAVSFDLVHPRGGLLAPALTSAVIHRMGLEVLLFNRLVARTLSLQHQLRARGVELPTSVPVPARALAAGDHMRTHLEAQMHAHGLPPGLLRLNVLVADEAYAYAAAAGGRATRCGVALDVPPPIAASIAHVNG